ncbi:MAG: preprotein translocase subunit SecE [Oscillospiraceae bacterium]|jgi:preprotein translocase subunit SecE|nr:preprotein translocase subunit SecE [Oscillospiraceae bacterium]
MSDEFDKDELTDGTETKPSKSRQPKAPLTKAEKKAAKKKDPRGSRLARWFREMKSELKKVVWPTPKQVTNNTLVALGVMFVSAIVLWGVDTIAVQIFQAIRMIAGKTS